MTREVLEDLCERLHRRELVHPDPLELVLPYEDLRDREVAGLVAASLAYGRVAQILKSVAAVLDAMGPSPAAFLDGATEARLRRTFVGFRHRWTRGEHLASLLLGAKAARGRHGSLGACLERALSPADETVLGAATAFAAELAAATEGGCGSLLSRPERGSACKRLHLYFRWMVRRDAVDPGGWDGVPTSLLIVPLDTHMHRIGRRLGLTTRKSADGRAAAEITRAFARFAPQDPVRYDFALTRLGIRADEDLEAFLLRFQR